MMIELAVIIGLGELILELTKLAVVVAFLTLVVIFVEGGRAWKDRW